MWETGSSAANMCLPMHTPEPPALIDCSTRSRISENWTALSPPEIRTGIGTEEVTILKDASEPGHGTLTTLQPYSHASLAACATPIVESDGSGLKFGPLG